MNLQLNDFCMGHTLIVDNEIIDANVLSEESYDFIIRKIFRKIINSVDKEQFILDYIRSNGEYIESERCEQCGDYNSVIKLEI